jgi:Mg/Co/Ni transporter MgtE
MCVEGWWRVVAVDTSFRARLRRMLPGPLASRIPPGQLLDWTQVEPFVGHVPTARLRLSHRKLARLHPAQIADLVEAASHEEGEEIIKAVGQDRELEADVFEELDDEHQLEFIRERSDSQVAAVLSRMAPDDAADLIAELDQERREPVLALLPAKKQRQIRTLLGYNPSTAGGLMSTEFLALPVSTPVADAIDRIRESTIAPEALSTIYASGGDGELVGSVPVVALLRAEPDATLADVLQREPLSVHTDADLPEVARLMTDYNLTTLPVVDEHQRMVGLITVDDVLEQMLPSGWRRRYGLARR